MKIMKKRVLNLLFSILVISLSFAQAEYLVYKKSQQKIEPISNKQKHSEIFNIMMRYQTPMIFNSNLNLKTELTTQEIKLLNQNEQKFLEQKLQKSVDSDLHILFVPTTLYELFVVKMVANKQYPYNNEFLHLKETFPTKNTSDPEAILNFEKIIFNTNTSSKLRQLHFFINKTFIKVLLQTKNIPLELTSAHKILAEQIKELQKYKNKNTQEFIDSLKEPISKFLLHESLKLEYEAHKNNSFLIYRGTAAFNYKDDKSSLILDNIPVKLNNRYQANSLCYGTTLLAAVFHSYYGACAHKYCAKKTNLAYALQIKKNDYLNKKTPYDIFYIPPYSTLSGLFESGNLFHARTRIDAGSTATAATNYFLKQTKKSLQSEDNIKTRKLLLSELETWELDAAYFSSTKSRLSLQKLEKQFNLFITKNIKFIKTKDESKFRNKALEKKLLKEHLSIAKNPLSRKKTPWKKFWDIVFRRWK
jgi:hypothetical protein